ncbi:MAG TPA: sugar transferase [Verrucomicrobiota bacterium]|nr:sugar transferase [Verrucomicrobiota bacterium]
MDNQNTTKQNDTSKTGSERFADGLPMWKRALDLAIVIFLLPGALFAGLLVALLIKCGSRGPVMFHQTRVGFKGRHFTCFKFRTMRVNADTKAHQGHTTQLIRGGGAMTKLDSGNDPRVIPFGTCLRATGLDELPQLLNVLRGDMSIVGPRPCIPYEYDLYEPWQRRRFDAVPGLTGLWQVSGKNRTTFNQMIHMDIDYSQRASLWLDLKILFKTIPALCTQCGDVIERRKKNRQAAAHRSESVTPPVRMTEPAHSNV